MRRLRTLSVLMALLLGTWLVLPAGAQNYLWTTIDGIPAAPSIRILSGGYIQNDALAPTLASGTGITTNANGRVMSQWSKLTVDYTNFTTNGVTHDVTLATLSVNSVTQWILANVTTPFVCAQTCTTATLSAVAGVSAGQNGYLLSFDIDAATGWFGDAQAEIGASLSDSGGPPPTPVGNFANPGSTSTVIARFTSGTGAWATTGVTNLNAGSITFYILSHTLP